MEHGEKALCVLIPWLNAPTSVIRAIPFEIPRSGMETKSKIMWGGVCDKNKTEFCGTFSPDIASVAEGSLHWQHICAIMLTQGGSSLIKSAQPLGQSKCFDWPKNDPSWNSTISHEMPWSIIVSENCFQCKLILECYQVGTNLIPVYIVMVIAGEAWHLRG